MNCYQTTPIAGAAHDQAKQGRPRLDLGRVVQRQGSDGSGSVASVQRYCTSACQSTQTSQTYDRHVLGLTFAKPSFCGPFSRTCTSRAGLPMCIADMAARRRTGSSSVYTQDTQSTWIFAFPYRRKTARAPRGKCGTWTCFLDDRSLIHQDRPAKERSLLHLHEDLWKCNTR